MKRFVKELLSETSCRLLSMLLFGRGLESSFEQVVASMQQNRGVSPRDAGMLGAAIVRRALTVGLFGILITVLINAVPTYFTWQQNRLTKEQIKLLIDQLELNTQMRKDQKAQFDAATRDRYLRTIYDSEEIECSRDGRFVECKPVADLRVREIAVRELVGMVNQYRTRESEPPAHYMKLVAPDLSQMNLRAVWFDGWDLDSALLSGTDLSLARLYGANLKNAQGLEQEQLDRTCGDSLTIIPKGERLQEPSHWLMTAWHPEKGFEAGCPPANLQ